VIVKIKQSGGRWILFDNAESVELDTTKYTVNSTEEVQGLGGPDDYTGCIQITPGADLSNGGRTTVGRLSYMSKGFTHTIVFNTIAYICNDSGKTVEKLDIGR